MSRKKKLIIAILVIVLAIPAGAFGYLYFKLNKMHDDKSDSAVLNKTDYKAVDGITNILLVGIDARDLSEKSRSDSMMLVTVDNKHKSLKATSFARDTYVDIPGHGKQKLTHAFAYGGIDLLAQTIENNFKVDIQDYAIVNFYSFMDIINSIDGIEVEVRQSELKELNRYIPECYDFYKNPKKDKDPKLVEKAGVQTLNAYQALAFSRIRDNDSAFERDGRQRLVVQAIVSKMSKISVTKYPGLVDSILPYVKTNMTPMKMIRMGATVLDIGNFDIHQLEFPIMKYSTGGIYGNSGWVLRYDADKCLPILNDFIFENVMYTPKAGEKDPANVNVKNPGSTGTGTGTINGTLPNVNTNHNTNTKSTTGTHNNTTTAPSNTHNSTGTTTNGNTNTGTHTGTGTTEHQGTTGTEHEGTTNVAPQHIEAPVSPKVEGSTNQ